MLRWLLAVLSLPTIVAGLIFLFGSHDARAGTLSIVAHALQVNEDGDVWLEKETGDAEWVKIAWIFGWGSNPASCENLLAAFAERYPEEKYRCQPVRGKTD